MNINLSKGGAGGGPYSKFSYCASPGRNGLYGKKPVAKMSIETGIKALASTSDRVLRSDPLVLAAMLAAVKVRLWSPRPGPVT